MGSPGRRSWIQRLLVVASAALAVGGLLAASTVAYGVYRVERVPTEPLRDVLAGAGQPPPDVGASGEDGGGDDAVDDVIGAPFNVLLVGDSSRDFVETDEDQRSFGADEGRGSDSILLVRIDPRAGTASTLPFPRDLWVELADGSGPARINRAYEEGGARLLIQTIQERFDVPVHHYVGVDFEGFRDLVDAVGGITLRIDTPVRDFNRQTGRNESGLDIPEPGCVTLGGDQALAYVRSRHFEQLVFLQWVPDGRNDFGRSERQQQFLRQVFEQATSEGLLDPGRLLDLLDVADQSITLSDDLDADRIADLVRDVQRISPDAYTDHTLPVTDLTTAAGAQVLELVAEEAEPILDVFRGVDEPPTTTTSTTSSTTTPEGGVAPVGPVTTEPPTPTTTAPPAPLC